VERQFFCDAHHKARNLATDIEITKQNQRTATQS